MSLGIIFACAKNTCCYPSYRCPRWDHLRMCGEHVDEVLPTPPLKGSPPHVRRTLCCGKRLIQLLGITSACAENTISFKLSSVLAGNHLRMCGEHDGLMTDETDFTGSPPHVRRTLRPRRRPCQSTGITSACAENTVKCELVLKIHRGSPPHVRRTRKQGVKIRLRQGITSACAENTHRHWHTHTMRRDHLRMCGEHQYNLFNFFNFTGSPPHVRRTPRIGDVGTPNVGITSACAENTKQHPCR